MWPRTRSSRSSCSARPCGGKTWLARLFAHLVGENPADVVLLMSSESGRSVFTRKGARGKTLSQRLVLDRAFVCFDEYQKAPPDVRRLCSIYIQGQKVVPYENESLRIEPVPLFTLNPRPGETLQDRLGFEDPQIRRSVLCDLESVEIPRPFWSRGEAILAEAAESPPLEPPVPRAGPADLARDVHERMPAHHPARVSCPESMSSAWPRSPPA